jgi:predicted dinucleotide-binding enzyme
MRRMRVGVLGTGVVGQRLSGKLVDLGHEVTMGSRSRGGEAAVRWAGSVGERAHEGTFAEAADFGEVVVNATAGAHSLEALRAAEAGNLAGKVLIDVANALAPNTGFPPQLAVCNTDSLAERIQREFPDARVVKTLNTVTADVMVNPRMIAGGHTVFISGDDTAAKEQVTGLLESFGWDRADVVDLGGVSSARGPEMYLPLWLHLFSTTRDAHFNIRLVRARHDAGARPQ